MPDLLAPLTGTITSLDDVRDPVFATRAVGDGIAICPWETGEELTVVAPVAGKAIRVMPHAFLILTDSGQAVLVHVGIDTVQLRGEGFTIIAEQGQTLHPGDPILRFRPEKLRQLGYDPICPVIVTNSSPGSITCPQQSTVTTGDYLLSF